MDNPSVSESMTHPKHEGGQFSIESHVEGLIESGQQDTAVSDLVDAIGEMRHHLPKISVIDHVKYYAFRGIGVTTIQGYMIIVEHEDNVEPDGDSDLRPTAVVVTKEGLDVMPYSEPPEYGGSESLPDWTLRTRADQDQTAAYLPELARVFREHRDSDAVKKALSTDFADKVIVNRDGEFVGLDVESLDPDKFGGIL